MLTNNTIYRLVLGVHFYYCRNVFENKCDQSKKKKNYIDLKEVFLLPELCSQSITELPVLFAAGVKDSHLFFNFLANYVTSHNNAELESL